MLYQWWQNYQCSVRGNLDCTFKQTDFQLFLSDGINNHIYHVVWETTPNAVVSKYFSACWNHSRSLKIFQCGLKLEHSSSIDERCDLYIGTCKHSTNDFNVQLNVGITKIVIKQSPKASHVQNSFFIYSGKVTSTTLGYD